MSMAWRWSGPLLTLAAIATCGCERTPSQLVVVVDSDFARGVLTAVEVDVHEIDDLRPVEPRGFDLSRTALPFSFGVTPPNGERGRRVEIEVVGRDARGVARVTQRLRTGFLPAVALRVPVFLARRCEGVLCDPDETCDASGACVSADLDPGSLTVVQPGDEIPDAGSIADASVPTLAAPMGARAFEHSVGWDVRSLVRLSDGTFVVTSQVFTTDEGGSQIEARTFDGTTLTTRWSGSVDGNPTRPLPVGDGFVMQAPVGDTPVTMAFPATTTLARPTELASGSKARAIVWYGADGVMRWQQMLWARPSMGDVSQTSCGVCSLGGDEIALTCRVTEAATIMLDGTVLALGPAAEGTLAAGSGGVILRARLGAAGLEDVRVLRWVSSTHDSYCAPDGAGGLYAAFRHTAVLEGLDRIHDPLGADTMTVARLDATGRLLWSERLLAARRNVSTPSVVDPTCYDHVALTSAPSGFYFASSLSPSTECLTEIENGAGAYAASWSGRPMVIATLGAAGEVSTDRLRVSSSDAIAWELHTHPSGTVLLAGEVRSGSDQIFGLPFATNGDMDGALVGLGANGQPAWVVQATSSGPAINDEFLGITTEPDGTIWAAGLHHDGVDGRDGTVLGAATDARFIVRLE